MRCLRDPVPPTTEDGCRGAGASWESSPKSHAMGQVSRARQKLSGAQLAPRDGSTLKELRRRRPQERIQEIPAEVLDFIPEGNCSWIPSDSLSVCALHEILRVCLDDRDTFLLLTKAGSMFPFPVCLFHTCRSGLCGSCGASHDRRRPSCHGVVCRRASLMSKLLEVLGLHALLPFVRALYRSPSCFIWEEVDFTQTPEPHVAFCPIFVHPF